MKYKTIVGTCNMIVWCSGQSDQAYLFIVFTHACADIALIHYSISFLYEIFRTSMDITI